MKVNYLAIILILIILLFAFNDKAKAQTTGIQVYPSTIEMAFSENKKFATAKIVAVNPTDKPVRVRAYVNDWWFDEYGNSQFTNKYPDKSLNDYIKFNPREFELGPREKQMVRLSAKTPEGVDAEYRSIIFFETVSTRKQLIDPDAKNLNIVINIKARYGVGLFAYKGNLFSDATIESLNFEVNKQPELIIEVKNTGNQHTFITGNITFINEETSNKLERTLAGYRIMPESTQKIKIQCPQGELKKGKYKALVELTYVDPNSQDKIIKAETEFTYEGSNETSTKEKLQKPADEKEIKLSPDNLAEPIDLEQTEIKLETN